MNFFSGYGRAKKSSYKNHLLAGAIVVFMFAAVAFGTASLFDKRTEWDGIVAPLERELMGYENTNGQYEAIQAKISVYERLHGILTSIDASINYVNFFSSGAARAIIAALPEGVTIDKFSVNETALEITGILDSMAMMPSLIQNLEDTGLFTNVTTSSASLLQSKAPPSGEGKTGQQFGAVIYKINCMLKGGAL